MARALSGPALEATPSPTASPTRGCWHKKSCHVCVPGGLRPGQESHHRCGSHHGAAAVQFHQKAFIRANGVALNVGFTTPDPEEAAVKAVAVRRAGDLVSGG